MKALGYSILLVDDNAIFIESFKYKLNKLIPDRIERLDQACNGDEAILLSSYVSYDYIFMDVVMPVVDGIAATKRIHEKNPLVNIVAISFHREFEYLKNILKAGAQYYLVKDSFEDSDLLRILKV